MKLKHYFSCFLLLVCAIVQAQNKGEYIVSYNGNGATSGSMTSHTFSIGVDEDTKLDANQYERKYNVSFNTQGGSDIAPKECVYDFVKWAHAEVLTDVTKNMENWYNICSNGNTGVIYKDLFTIANVNGVNHISVLTRGSTRERLYTRPLYMPAGDYEVDFKFCSPSGYSDLGKEWEINFKMAAVDVPQIDYGNDYGMLTKGDEKSAVLLKHNDKSEELEDRTLPIYANGETPVYLSVNCGNVSDGVVNRFNFADFVFKKDGSSTLYYSDEEPTKNMVREDSGAIALSAVWEANAIALPLPEKNGAEFVEWNTKADGTGTAYNAGDNFTTEEDIILYAIWKSGTPDDGALSKPCGEGTEECPFHIKKAGELLYFASVINGDNSEIEQNVSAYAVLDEDIDLSSVCGPEIGSWTPIGLNPVSFKGVFDGRNHRIKNIYMNGSTVEGQGLFGIGSRCVIKNVVIESGVISANGPAVGAIGGVISGQIINCHNYATVINSKKFNGGIVGYMSSNSLLQRCHNEGTITSISSDKSQFGVGGIAGAVSTNTLVTDCYNLGDITGNSSRVGGVIGSAENCHVTNCYSIADVESRPNDYGGGLCAVIYDHYPNTVVEHSYYYNRLQGSSQQLDMWHPEEEFEDGTIYKELDEKSPNLWRQEEGKYPVFIDTVFASEKYQLKRVTICKGDSIAFDGQVFKTAGTYYAGGDCKCGGDTLVLTVAEPSTFELNETIKEGESYAFGDTTITDAGTYTRTIVGGNESGCDSIITLSLKVESNITPIDNVAKRPCGKGTPECPFHITNSNELLYFAAVVNGNVDTIAKNESAYGVLDEDIDLSNVCGPEIGSWTPIGFDGVHYKGNFDGRNHKISNIYMEGSTVGGQGLFGYFENAEIKNIILASGIISSKGIMTGGIAGVGIGKVYNCHNYATVICDKKFNGGIIGYLGRNSDLQRCHNEGTITSISSDKSQFGVGGIAGAAFTSSVVKDCYNLGNITGNSSRVGGVIGSAENCLVTNCYSIADVESRPNDFGGGLCAVIYSDYPDTKVEHSYYYNRLQGSSQQLDMWHPVEEFEDGTIFKELDEKSPNLWRQETGKYPVFKDIIFEPAVYKTEYVTLCKGDSVLFAGKYLKEAGSYTTECECNGGDTLVVSIALPSEKTVTETINEGESYTFGNKTLTESGTYTRTIEGGNVNGCDSIITLELTVRRLGPVCIPVYDSIITSICDGDTFQFAGKDLTTTGIYADTTLAANGCDSTTVLNLTVKPNTTFVIRDTISAGDNYSSNGFSLDVIETLGEFTFYNTVGVNQYGCDSITALHLHVRKPIDGIFIPTLFTPYNGDGINDRFMKGYDVMIWDRYGNLICNSNDGWDGTYRGAIADPGVYIYVVTLKDGRKKKGSIEVFKED
ncbi:MAG: InlB B-repeat-containing protein [Bacteroidales bacterium]|nr:InlB B-repeat-containing protein [Candidatus Physcocola equi]